MALIFSTKQIQSYKQCNKRINILEGAIRSGKTFVGFYIWMKYVLTGPPGVLLMCGKTLATLERNVLQAKGGIFDMLGEGNYRYVKNKGELYIGDRIIYCVGASDEKSESKIRGMTCAGAFCDEVTLYPESFVNQLDSRCSVKGSKLFFTCNPDSPNHYIKLNYLDRVIDGYHKNISVISFLMEDNPSLDKEYVSHLKSTYTGVFYERFIMGRWVLAEGVIYTNFSYQEHTIPKEELPHRFDSLYVACDYGITNPHVYLLIGQIRERGVVKSYVIKEDFIVDKDGRNPKTDVSLFNAYKRFTMGLHIQNLIIDPSASSIINYFKSKGITPKAAHNEVLDGISNVASKLGSGELYICREGCPNLIKEFEGYIWDAELSKRGIDGPMKVNDHCLTGDTLVDTIEGVIQIKDLVGKTGIVHCYDEENKIATTSTFSDARMTREQADIYELELEDGRKIRATYDHLILTQRGWIQLGHLTCDDDIIDIGGTL